MKISDVDAFKILKLYKIPLAEYISLDPEYNQKKLKRAAKKLGYPLVLKADLPKTIHKKSKGCVKIVNRGELKKKFKDLLKDAKKVSNQINNIIAQKYIFGDELIVGGKKDKKLGHSVIFGIGGPMTEIIEKISFRLVPVSKEDAKSMIHEVGLESFLKEKRSYRTTRKVIQKVSRMLDNRPEIEELDINPIFVPGCIAGDVRLIEGKKVWR